MDILVRRDRAKAACDYLERRGWAFAPENGLLWLVSRAASFDRDGFTVDLHWGLHAAHLPAWSLEPLGRRLWQGARRGSSGMLEPDPESLLVFLAVRAPRVMPAHRQRLQFEAAVALAQGPVGFVGFDKARHAPADVAGGIVEWIEAG